MPYFHNNGARLYYIDEGEGPPFVFQHGLGADVRQVRRVLGRQCAARLICFDARGHGRSGTGHAGQTGLASAADDLRALLFHLKIKSAVVGGISMGAAIALRFAIANQERTKALILVRPAWGRGPNPFNQAIYRQIAHLVRKLGPTDGLAAFRALPSTQELVREFPETAKSLFGQFRGPRCMDLVHSFEKIPSDSPYKRLKDLGELRVPTLIMANRRDPVHPFEYGQLLAGHISGAALCEIPSKEIDPVEHARQVGVLACEFLQQSS